MRKRRFTYLVMWITHPWLGWGKKVIVQLQNHWYLLIVYYVQSALTLQDNLLEVNRNILSTRHLTDPVLGLQDGKLSPSVSSPIAEERLIMCFTPWIGLSGGLIYLLSTHPSQP